MKKFLLIPLAVVLVTALIFGGCKPAAEVPEEIRVGLTASQTGPAAGFALGNVFGMQAATDDINSLGGIYVEEYGKKLPVRLIVLNNESNPEKGGILAEDLVLRDKVQFLLNAGPLDFDPPAAVVAERYKVPHMSGPGPYEAWQGVRTSIEPMWEYSYMISFAIATPPAPGDFRADKPGYTMFEVWAGALDEILPQTNKKIALLASADPDGMGWYEGFYPATIEFGCEPYRADEGFGITPGETTDFSPLINEWKAANCEMLWCNTTATFFGTFWRQAHTLGYHPKQVFASRAGLFYTDINAWGGDLPQAICNEMFWHPDLEGCVGIGGTTPKELGERWYEETGLPFHQVMGLCYADAQVLYDAIERAGTLDGEAVLQAIGETDMNTMFRRVVFDEEKFSRIPCFFGQWQKTDKAWVWDNPVVFSQHDFLPATAEIIFPVPYD